MRKLDDIVARGSYATRAAALTATLDRLIEEDERRELDRAIVEGYTRVPPTADENAQALESGRRSIASEPW